VILASHNSPEQRVRTIQLGTAWSIAYEDGNIRTTLADSAHTLQVNPEDYREATLYTSSLSGEILLHFSDDYPPQSVSVQRWNARYQTGSQNVSALLDKGEPVEAYETMIHLRNDGHDYVYEVSAFWADGRSTYTFRVECSVPSSPNVFDSESLDFSVDIQTEYYEYINEDAFSNITVEYLQISGHPDSRIEQSINLILGGMAWLYEISPTEEDLFYDMKCEYTILAGRYLSASYYMQYDHRGDPHPWRWLDSIVLDLKTGLEVELADVINIDGRLRNKLTSREFDYSDEGESQIVGLDEGALEEVDLEDFYRQICSYGFFILSENSIGFIVEVPHYIGDYWVLAFPYESIDELMHPWFTALLHGH